MQLVHDKMDIQRAPNAVQREKGVDVTAIMDGKSALSSLRVPLHKAHLVEGLQLRGIRGVSEQIPWNKLTKRKKAFEKNEQGWFEPRTDFFKDNRVRIMQPNVKRLVSTTGS
jgi:hypothetical protein